MNLELLKKLVKLANNNPNDNEANLAARKVCKMIEAENFNFNNHVTITPKDIKQPETQYQSQTYNDVKRSTEPFWRSNRPSYGFDTEFWNDWMKSETKRSEEERKRYEHLRNGEWDIASDEFYKREQKEKRALKCKTCGYKHETVYVGPEELFECNPCQWTAYQNRNAK